MITLAKTISLLIIVEGCLSLLFPSFMRSMTEEFASSSSAAKRRTGVLSMLIGAGLFYLSRLWLAEPLPHWVVSVCGVYMLLAGLFIAFFPSAAGRSLRWFYREKNVTSFIGFILILAGAVLMVML